MNVTVRQLSSVAEGIAEYKKLIGIQFLFLNSFFMVESVSLYQASSAARICSDVAVVWCPVSPAAAENDWKDL